MRTGVLNVDCVVAKNTHTENDKVAITIANDNIYAGTVGEGFPTDLVRTLVGIRNKKTNKVYIIQQLLLGILQLITYFYVVDSID